MNVEYHFSKCLIHTSLLYLVISIFHEKVMLFMSHLFSGFIPILSSDIIPGLDRITMQGVRDQIRVSCIHGRNLLLILFLCPSNKLLITADHSHNDGLSSKECLSMSLNFFRFIFNFFKVFQRVRSKNRVIGCN